MFGDDFSRFKIEEIIFHSCKMIESIGIFAQGSQGVKKKKLKVHTKKTLVFYLVWAAQCETKIAIFDNCVRYYVTFYKAI